MTAQNPIVTSYHSLVAGKDYLGNFTVLDVDKKNEAEREARDWINTEFNSWDRQTWSGEEVPPDVRYCALRVASAAYITRSSTDTNPFGPEEGFPLPERLMQEAEDKAAEVRSRAWMLDHHGAPLKATGPDAGQSDMVGRVTR